jgi:Penicillin binding protein transpeptidase domain
VAGDSDDDNAIWDRYYAPAPPGGARRPEQPTEQYPAQHPGPNPDPYPTRHDWYEPQPPWSDSPQSSQWPPPPQSPLDPQDPQTPRGHRAARPPKRRRRKRGIAITAAAVAVVAGAAGAFVVVTKHGSTAHTTGFLPTGTTAEQDAAQTTRAFLQAWQRGNTAKAASYTNHPAATKAAFAAYSKYLHLRKLTSATSPPTAITSSRWAVKYTLTATVATSGSPTALHGAWTYHASLTTYQEKNSQLWYVAWAPDVLAPNLTATTHLATIQVAPTVGLVNDANGNELVSYHDPGLTTISGLMQQAAPPGHGSPGLDVEIQTAAGKAVPHSQAVVIAPGNISNLDTTISASAETAAQAAVAAHTGSSMVVIQPSTGDILAIANNAGYNDFALTAAVAPGSTMKIITSTALINAGVVTANSDVACPPSYTVQGITYHNDDGESEPATSTLTNDFAQSCNNAFDQWWPDLSGRLASTAKNYYGLDQNWDIGIGGLSASYFNAPASASGSELAQEAFGEGELTASPLAMASVAATVDTGQFLQPVLLAGTPRVTATALPTSTDAQLKQMMAAVVSYGTAEPIGFGPGIYAKTGTADIQGQDQPNSWLIAFDPSQDVAVACLVVDAGYGAQFAGPEVNAFLTKY